MSHILECKNGKRPGKLGVPGAGKSDCGTVRFAARVITGAAALLVLFAWGSTQQAGAQTFSTLHNFSGTTSDGANPQAGLVQDSVGNLYGTTLQGGSANYGTVFKLAPSSTPGTYTETVLHSFNGSDGIFPAAGLIQDSAGNLYGTTSLGGSSRYGTVFKVTTSGTETVLHSFNFNDGAYLYAGLVQDAAGNLYGTNSVGGSGGYGTVFKLAPSSTPGTYTETVLYSFTGGSDGGDPYAGLVRDSAGNLYGTTGYGGTGYGTVFKITSSGTETVLHSFTGGSDGGNPFAGLIRDSAGNLYGTTYGGGSANDGTVFKLTPGSSGTYTETVLHSFTNGNDGGSPVAALIQDSAGNLYGTTYRGGSANDGTVFKLAPSSTAGTYTETVLHSFNFTDGGYPAAGLIQDSAGNLYGTTSAGGSGNYGTVFKIALTVPFSAFSAKLDITSGPPPGFQLKANFTQGSGAPAINPPSQPVTLTVGTYSVTLPVGSFHETPKGFFVYQGTLNGVALQIRIAPSKTGGTNSYVFQVDASGVDLSSLSDPVTVSISIGQNTGTTKVAADF